MQIHFEANQPHQIEAIEAVCALFEGQETQEQSAFSLNFVNQSLQMTEKGIGNRLHLVGGELLANLQKVQAKNGLKVDTELKRMESGFQEDVPCPFNFSIEMETGTGKTYAYLRTIYELNKQYGFLKFVIVVPSVAIREGVKKNLQITETTLQEMFGRVNCQYTVYDSSRLADLRNFAVSNAIQILVINIDSFAKDNNVINKSNDKLSGLTPIEFLQHTKPIVILDEPQNMERDLRKKAINQLNPLCTLRYSATHRNSYNLIYRLDPVSAYEQGLVKKIEVTSVVLQNAHNEAYIKLISIDIPKANSKGKMKNFSAKLEIHVEGLLKNEVLKQSVKVENGKNLYDLSGRREVYRDYWITEIGQDFVRFSNGKVLYKQELQSDFVEDIQRQQIERTIDRHFQKEKLFREKGLKIKILSIFFIDRVANYRSQNEQGENQKGKFAEWFEELFEAKNKQYKLYDYRADQLHNGYFATDKKGKPKDSNENRLGKDEESAFDLIMRDKERLLDDSEPLRFIFSHSALREGWDNPNVFQICTLNATQSEMKKRQEIGRGLRLCVNQEGKRTDANNLLYNHEINRLTIIANESYEVFAKKLQEELEEDGIVKKLPIENADLVKAKIKVPKKAQLDENFVALWERIKYRTRYQVHFDSEALIEKTSKALSSMGSIKPPFLEIKRAEFELSKEKLTSVAVSHTIDQLQNRAYVLPDFLSYIQQHTQLTRPTIAQILRKSGRLAELRINPQAFLTQVVRIIKNEMNDLVLESGIEYEKTGLYYDMSLFEQEHEILLEEIEKHYAEVRNEQKTLYKYIRLDSNTEREFLKNLDSKDETLFYIKLPDWFKVPTPIGNYNPDWGIVFQPNENANVLYLVAETKSQTHNLRKEESQKINCGEKHFDQQHSAARYSVLRTYEELVQKV